MPQVSFSADIKPLFRAIDIASHETIRRRTGQLHLHVESGQRIQSARRLLSPHDGEPPHNASRWALLDSGPARTIGAMAVRRIPAVTLSSRIESSYRFEWTGSESKLGQFSRRREELAVNTYDACVP